MRIASKIGLAAVAIAMAVAGDLRAQVESGVIRLAEPTVPAEEAAEPATEADPLSEARRGFDVEAFDGRLEGLWFQRKAYERDGRPGDAERQAGLIRDFVAEEGVKRLEAPAGALVLEARGWLREGNAQKALAALTLAEALDPQRPQVLVERARVLWASDAGAFAAVTELIRAMRLTLKLALRDLTLVHESALLAVVALVAALGLTGLLLVLRYQAPLRHDVEEWLTRGGHEASARAGGWALLLLPFLTWIGAGWAVLYGLVVTFRYARRAEKGLVVALLVALAAVAPAYRFAVGLYGLAADPTVRTTIDAANGAYDPDRIVKLRELVDAHPDDPMYRFLLAGLYKNGRYFEEAFGEYKRVLETAPATFQARINLGNIYFLLGQYGEATSHYRKAIELRPDSVLAYYNMYLAQSDSFKLKEAAESLARAREIDPAEINRLLSLGSGEGSGPKVIDASIDFGSIWRATVEGRHLREWLDAGSEEGALAGVAESLANPLSLAAIVALVGCGAVSFQFRGRAPARACLRCGRTFCAYCKPGRDAHEFCSQCVHLFVLGDGLSPETKGMKLYEIERHAAHLRFARRAVSVVVPGASQVLTGRPWIGTLFIALWMVAWVAGAPALIDPIARSLAPGLPLAGLRPGPVPAVGALEAATVLAVPLGLLVWLLANLGARRERSA